MTITLNGIIGVNEQINRSWKFLSVLSKLAVWKKDKLKARHS